MTEYSKRSLAALEGALSKCSLSYEDVCMALEDEHTVIKVVSILRNTSSDMRLLVETYHSGESFFETKAKRLLFPDGKLSADAEKKYRYELKIGATMLKIATSTGKKHSHFAQVEIAEKLGYSQQRLSQAIRRHNIDLRDLERRLGLLLD